MKLGCITPGCLCRGMVIEPDGSALFMSIAIFAHKGTHTQTCPKWGNFPRQCLKPSKTNTDKNLTPLVSVHVPDITLLMHMFTRYETFHCWRIHRSKAFVDLFFFLTDLLGYISKWGDKSTKNITPINKDHASMGGTRLKFESWQVRNHPQNAPLNHFLLLSVISESWNLDAASEVPPMRKFCVSCHDHCEHWKHRHAEQHNFKTTDTPTQTGGWAFSYAAGVLSSLTSIRHYVCQPFKCTQMVRHICHHILQVEMKPRR